jgi:WD40 repeat protein/tetratricopeptide (TPR) repeat protein
MTDVFISYSRKDKEFVKTLHTALVQDNRDTWVDWEDIPLTADWWQEIQRGIEAADTFVFVLSPDSVASKICTQEVDHAVQHHKRLFPIVRREDFDTSQVHAALCKHNWLFFREMDNFDRVFQDLVTAISTDLDYVRAHTRLLVRAIEWEQSKRDASFLLRGNDLKAADRWLSQGLEKEPQPTTLQTQYIFASGKAEIQRQRQARIITTVGLVGAIGLALLALTQYQQARQRQLEAEKGQILALSASANANLTSNQDIEALIAAIKLGQQLSQSTNLDTETQATAMSALQQVIYGVKEQNRLEDHNDYVREVVCSPDGQTIATASDDKTVKLWRRDGTLLRTLKLNTYVRSVSFNPDGQTLAMANFDRTVQLWNTEGQRLKTLKGHQDIVNSVVFSPDGKTLASASLDNTIRLWNREGTLLQTLKGHPSEIRQVAFSPNGKILASASEDRTIKLWQLDGTLIRTLKGHQNSVWAVDFSPDGKILASASEDRTIKLWNLDGTLIRTLKGHSGGVFAISFSPDGKALASGGDANDKTIRFWKIDGTLLRSLKGHSDWISSLRFSPNGQTLLSTSADGTAKFWQLNSPLLTSLKGEEIYDVRSSLGSPLMFMLGLNGTVTLAKADGTPVKPLSLPSNAGINDSAISPVDGTFAIAGADNRITLWQPDGTLLRSFPTTPASIQNLRFSADGQTLATLSREDRTLRLWTLQGQLIQAFPGPTEWGNWAGISPDLNGVLTIAGSSINSSATLWGRDGKRITPLQGHQGEIGYASFSPDGQTIATASFDKTAKLWTADGKLLTTLKGHTAAVTLTQFSPDGQQIVTASGDSTLKIWKRDGTLITSLRTDSPPTMARFTPDGNALIYITDGTAHLWNISDLNSVPTLMAQGCILLQDYLISHPKRLLELEPCQTPATLLPAGQNLATLEDIPNAVKLLRRALQQDAQLKFDPEQEAQKFANQGQAQRLLEAGQDLALEGNMTAAVAKFQEVVKLDQRRSLNPEAEAQQWAAQGQAERVFQEGVTLAQAGQLQPVVQKFRQAVQINPDLGIESEVAARQFVAARLKEQAYPLIRQGNIAEAIALTQRAEAILPLEFHNLYFVNNWDNLCWGGSLWNQPAKVLSRCEKSVAAYPDNGMYRDSRGIARALTGNAAGAIADFQAYIEWADNDERKAQRQSWIKALQAGKNPFMPAELAALREKQL